MATRPSMEVSYSYASATCRIHFEKVRRPVGNRRSNKGLMNVAMGLLMLMVLLKAIPEFFLSRNSQVSEEANFLIDATALVIIGHT